MTFLLLGAFSLVPKRYSLAERIMPNLEERLIPVRGYGPPKRWRYLIIVLEFLTGGALIAWGML